MYFCKSIGVIFIRNPEILNANRLRMFFKSYFIYVRKTIFDKKQTQLCNLKRMTKFYQSFNISSHNSS